MSNNMLHCYTDTKIQRYKDVLLKGKIMADRRMINLTITMTKEERKELKQIALDNDTTVSALIRDWLKRYKSGV